MEFKFSKHAKERINDRGLDYNTVLKVLNSPDHILQESDCKKIYQKIVSKNELTYLYRIFVNIYKQPPLVITAYKTSKIDKYEY